VRLKATPDYYVSAAGPCESMAKQDCRAPYSITLASSSFIYPLVSFILPSAVSDGHPATISANANRRKRKRRTGMLLRRSVPRIPPRPKRWKRWTIESRAPERVRYLCERAFIHPSKRMIFFFGGSPPGGPISRNRVQFFFFNFFFNVKIDSAVFE